MVVWEFVVHLRWHFPPSWLLLLKWDSRWTSKAWTTLHESTNSALDRARLSGSRAPHAGDWLLARAVTALGLRLSDDVIRIAVGIRLGTTLCEPHLCHCGQRVDARGTHGLACRKTAGR